MGKFSTKIKKQMKDKYIVVNALNDLPLEISNDVYHFMILCIFLFICSIVFAITKLNVMYFFMSLGLLVLALIFFYFSWYRYFQTDNVYVIEGTVTEISRSIKGKDSKDIFLSFIKRSTYQLLLENGVEFTVVQTNTKVRKEGSKIRLYVAPESICQKSDMTNLINNVLKTVIIKK